MLTHGKFQAATQNPSLKNLRYKSLNNVHSEAQETYGDSLIEHQQYESGQKGLKGNTQLSNTKIVENTLEDDNEEFT